VRDMELRRAVFCSLVPQKLRGLLPKRLLRKAITAVRGHPPEAHFLKACLEKFQDKGQEHQLVPKLVNRSGQEHQLVNRSGQQEGTDFVTFERVCAAFRSF
ncbi:unnamed protein product, partial [Polarella glacialis]